jgi:histidinol-phosphate aminotransferase
VVGGDRVGDFVDSLPETALVVVDEAYHEYASDPYQSMVSRAGGRKNLVVLRTFSKVYSLAAFRIGYGVGHPDTIAELRKIQAPLTVNRVAQTAALASLGQPGELARRVEGNAAGRRYLSAALSERGVQFVPSHTNFIYFRVPQNGHVVSEQMTRQGVIVRPMGGDWLRVTVGLEGENRRFVEVLESVL